jgi:hypothetical protein
MTAAGRTSGGPLVWGSSRRAGKGEGSSQNTPKTAPAVTMKRAGPDADGGGQPTPRHGTYRTHSVVDDRVGVPRSSRTLPVGSPPEFNLRTTHRHGSCRSGCRGRAALAHRSGANLAPERAVGRRTWEEFLAEGAARSAT